jgi:hypothetical protein
VTEFATEIAVLIGVLGCLLVGPGIAIAFLLWRKKLRRARRRSPIGIELLRAPGHTLREQVDEAASDLIWDVLILSLIPLLALAIYLAQAHLRGWSGMRPLAWVYVVAVVGFIAWMIRKLIMAGDRLDRLRTGFDAELAVGQELDQLMRTGAAVFHDFPAEGFNIDHIVISTQGVYAVETKGYPKPTRLSGKAAATVVFDGHTLKFPTWSTEEPLLQAERQAKWLSKWMTSALGQMVLVTPVLALPGWFVQLTGRSAVRVYSGRALGTLLSARSRQPLTEQDVQRVAHQVEKRCRTVPPTYGREAGAR